MSFTVALAGLAALTLPAAALATSYAIIDVEIEARIETDGTLVVREWRRFRGDYSRIIWELDEQGSQGIEVIGVGDREGPFTVTYDLENRRPGTYRVSAWGSTTRVDVVSRSDTPSARFGIEYRALGAAQRWDDTAELYWQLVGPGWGVPADRVRATVTPPPGVTGEEVRVWAQGPLWGNVSIGNDGVVLLEVDDLPASTFVEVRMLFPPEAAPSAPYSPGSHFDAVVKAEAEREAVAEAERAAQQRRRRLAIEVAIFLPAAGLGFIAILFLRRGRERRPKFRGRYYRDVPDPALPPAYVGYLMHSGRIRDTDAVATLLDLANRGVIEIAALDEPVGDDGRARRTYRLTLLQPKPVGLRRFEKSLITLLFHHMARADAFTMEELRRATADKRKRFGARYDAWRAQVRRSAAGAFSWESPSDLQVGAVFVVGSSAVLGGIMVSVGTESVIPALGIPAGVAVFVLGFMMYRASRKVVELRAKYGALRDYLEDFGRLHEKPPDAVVLWEHFLVLAVVFGIADDAMDGMRFKVPWILQASDFRKMRFMASPTHGGSKAVSSLGSGFPSEVTVGTAGSGSSESSQGDGPRPGDGRVRPNGSRHREEP
jgi:uncharacterized membrane protein